MCIINVLSASMVTDQQNNLQPCCYDNKPLFYFPKQLVQDKKVNMSLADLFVVTENGSLHM